MRMVWAGAKPSLRLASCCSVEVVKGGGGLRLAGLASTLATVNAALSNARLKASASAGVPMSSRWIFWPSAPTRRASNSSPRGVASVATSDQYERATGEIGVDERAIDLARVLHGVEHRLLGDGVEHHPLDRLLFEGVLLLQHFEHVPGNRLAFAIGVGGEDQLVGPLE